MEKDPKREALKGFLQIGAFIGVTGLLLALVQPPDSGEFVVSVCSAMIGGVLMAAAAIMIRLSR